jgi:hypothetical protein
MQNAAYLQVNLPLFVPNFSQTGGHRHTLLKLLNVNFQINTFCSPRVLAILRWTYLSNELNRSITTFRKHVRL